MYVCVCVCACVHVCMYVCVQLSYIMCHDDVCACIMCVGGMCVCVCALSVCVGGVCVCVCMYLCM